MTGPGGQVEISDSIELCIVELMRVDCILKIFVLKDKVLDILYCSKIHFTARLTCRHKIKCPTIYLKN